LAVFILPIVPHFSHPNIYQAKITQEILSSTCQKTAFIKLFQKTVEAPFIKSLILSKIKI